MKPLRITVLDSSVDDGLSAANDDIAESTGNMDKESDDEYVEPTPCESVDKNDSTDIPASARYANEERTPHENYTDSEENTCSPPRNFQSSANGEHDIPTGRVFPKKPKQRPAAYPSTHTQKASSESKRPFVRALGIKRKPESTEKGPLHRKPKKTVEYKLESFYLDAREVSVVDTRHPKRETEILDALGICPSTWNQCAKRARKDMYGAGAVTAKPDVCRDVLDWITVYDRSHMYTSILERRAALLKAYEQYAEECITFGNELSAYRERKIRAYVDAELKYRQTKENDPTGDMTKLESKHNTFVKTTAGIGSDETLHLLRRTVHPSS